MEQSLHVKIQYFADLLAGQIVEMESGLMLADNDRDEEKKIMIRSQCYQEILERFENLFQEIVYKEKID